MFFFDFRSSDIQDPNTKYYKKDNTTYLTLFTGLVKEIGHKQTIQKVVQIIQRKRKMATKYTDEGLS